MINSGADLDRVWKEFGKQTQAGKLLYDLYGVRFRPDKFVNYPKLKMKEKEEKVERAKSSSNLKQAVQKVSYPEPEIKKSKYTFHKVDFIPKRKKEEVIKKEIEGIKSNMVRELNTNRAVYKNPQANRKLQIERLQDKFQFQERTVMPKGARLPGIKVVDTENEVENINNDDLPKAKPVFGRHNRREELDYLYDQVMKEIDERYVYMESIKKLGKNMDSIIMGEIKERLDELKKIQKMIDEYDKSNK